MYEQEYPEVNESASLEMFINDLSANTNFNKNKTTLSEYQVFRPLKYVASLQ